MDQRRLEKLREETDAQLYGLAPLLDERGAAARAVLEERRMAPLVEASKRAAAAAESSTKTATWAMWAAIGSCVAALIAAVAAIVQAVR